MYVCVVCAFVCVCMCMHGCDSYMMRVINMHDTHVMHESGARNQKASGRTREDVLFRSRSKRFNAIAVGRTRNTVAGSVDSFLR